jgi:hypothetical protein
MNSQMWKIDSISLLKSRTKTTSTEIVQFMFTWDRGLSNHWAFSMNRRKLSSTRPWVILTAVHAEHLSTACSDQSQRLRLDGEKDSDRKRNRSLKHGVISAGQVSSESRTKNSKEKWGVQACSSADPEEITINFDGDQCENVNSLKLCITGFFARPYRS